MCLVARDIVAGGFLLGIGYCRRDRWRFLEYIFFFGECVLGSALIFGRIGPRPAPWAALLFEHNSRPRENGRRKKGRRRTPKTSVTFIFVPPIGKYAKNACRKWCNPFKNVCSGKCHKSAKVMLHVFLHRENPLFSLGFKGFLQCVDKMSKIFFGWFRKCKKYF